MLFIHKIRVADPKDIVYWEKRSALQNDKTKKVMYKRYMYLSVHVILLWTLPFVMLAPAHYLISKILLLIQV